MFSHDVTPLPVATRRGSMRRGGPFLFATIWPEVRATLAETNGFAVPEAPPRRPGDDGPPPPWSRAA